MIFGAVPPRIYIATRPIDFRKGIDGLAAAVQEVLRLDPFSGTAFIFRAKRGDRIKILIWDGSGLILIYKRLEEGKFHRANVYRERQALTYGRRSRTASCVCPPYRCPRCSTVWIGPASAW